MSYATDPSDTDPVDPGGRRRFAEDNVYVYYVRYCDLQCAIRWLELDILLRASKYIEPINRFPMIPKKVATQMDLLTSVNTENGCIIGSSWSSIRQMVKLFCSDLIEGQAPNFVHDIYDWTHRIVVLVE